MIDRATGHHHIMRNHLTFFLEKMYDAMSWYNVRIWCLTYLDYTNSTTWERKVGSEVHSKNISYLIWSRHVQQHRHIHRNSPQHNLTSNSNRFSNKIISPCWYFRLSGIIAVFFQRCKVFNIFNLLKSSPFGCQRVKQWNPKKAGGRKNELKTQHAKLNKHDLYIIDITQNCLSTKIQTVPPVPPFQQLPITVEGTPPAFFASGSPLLTVAPDLSTTVTAADSHRGQRALNGWGSPNDCDAVLYLSS